MTRMEWCNSLSKPAPATISLIWALVHPVITVSLWFVFVQAFREKMPSKMALTFAVDLVANLPSMPVFAGLRASPQWRTSR